LVLADFYVILAEIQNCPGVPPTIRFEMRGKLALVREADAERDLH
jgi:hypothetical protein